ncbi:M48 family metallopeptidase [Flavobacterium sp.]|uniref:M48 family metallopeptidase n=1 Tax=Flavobacterium sp. TaxID=239 RepID=UPI00260D7248|nr:M48 family metallopeptidase [Flavobacterium sp.]
MNIEISNNFKKMTTKAIVSIVLFLIVYILLLLLAIGLTIASVIGGFYIITFKLNAITIGFGIGLASLGFFILAFLFKFIFKKHKTDLSHLTEITEKTEPKLFHFINEIVKEVETDFPKKIYLSSDVNASVFYDSSFWSMFFPIKKNLQIGLGLVNTCTEQEFKAIMAHEFGHFSQKSMKVGSYVYNVNQVIFNMLYDNESFDKMIQQWANISGYFSIFVIIAVKIIEGIQWILKKMYEFININYLALSREMEFHADEVAANVAGYIPLKESLLRMDLANHSFNSVLGFYENKLIENIRSSNLYKEQSFVLKFLADKSSLPIKNDLPIVSPLDLSKFNKSKLVIKDQWASHPSTEERIVNLERLNITKNSTNEQLANLLFSDIEKLQENLTKKLFSFVDNADQLTSLQIEDFKTQYHTDFEDNSFNKIYNGYYDHKNPNYFDIVTATGVVNQNHNFEYFFNKENIDMIYDYIALENDKNMLVNIDNKTFTIKTFDYDGKKYKAQESSLLLPKIEKEIEELKVKITNNDVAIYSHFYQLAKDKEVGSELKSKYNQLFANDQLHDKKAELYTNLIEATEFLRVSTPFETIVTNLKTLKKIETELKKEIKLILENPLLQSDISASSRENFENYLKEDYVYFSNNEYRDKELHILSNAINDFSYYTSRNYFFLKKDLLNFQAELLSNKN